MLGKSLGFWASRIPTCCWTNNQKDNCPKNNLSKTHQTHYFTHHLALIVPNLWVAHLQLGISQGLQKWLTWKTLHQHKPEIVKGLRVMTLNELPHNNFKKLSWIFSWNTQWHTLMVLLGISKGLAWRSINKSWKTNFWWN